MDLLLDSHSLLWWDHDRSKLSALQRFALDNPRNEIYVSAATVWELGIKRSKGKLTTVRSIPEMVQHFGFVPLPVTVAHADAAANLPLLHGDPFDRMLVAQAFLEGLTLVTVDSMIQRYGVAVLD